MYIVEKSVVYSSIVSANAFEEDESTIFWSIAVATTQCFLCANNNFLSFRSSQSILLGPLVTTILYYYSLESCTYSDELFTNPPILFLPLYEVGLMFVPCAKCFAGVTFFCMHLKNKHHWSVSAKDWVTLQIWQSKIRLQKAAIVPMHKLMLSFYLKFNYRYSAKKEIIA